MNLYKMKYWSKIIYERRRKIDYDFWEWTEQNKLNRQLGWSNLKFKNFFPLAVWNAWLKSPTDYPLQYIIIPTVAPPKVYRGVY